MAVAAELKGALRVFLRGRALEPSGVGDKRVGSWGVLPETRAAQSAGAQQWRCSHGAAAVGCGVKGPGLSRQGIAQSEAVPTWVKKELMCGGSAVGWHSLCLVRRASTYRGCTASGVNVGSERQGHARGTR